MRLYEQIISFFNATLIMGLELIFRWELLNEIAPENGAGMIGINHQPKMLL